jgi:hypothetical protein
MLFGLKWLMGWWTGGLVGWVGGFGWAGRLRSQDHVLWGNVSVNDVAIVDIGEDGQQVAEKMQHFRLRKAESLLFAIAQLLAVGLPLNPILYQKQPVILLKSCPEPWNLGMLNLMQNVGFPMKQSFRFLDLLLLLIGNQKLLQHTGFVKPFLVQRQVSASKTALTQDLLNLIPLPQHGSHGNWEFHFTLLLS